MWWLPTALIEILEFLAAWFLKKKVKQAAYFLAYVTFSTGLFVAFVGASFAAIWAAKPLVPPGLEFALCFIPASVPVYFSIYMSILISKRVYDYQKRITKDFTQFGLGF